MAHNLIIKREMGEPLAKAAIQPLTAGTGFLLSCLCGS